MAVALTWGLAGCAAPTGAITPAHTSTAVGQADPEMQGGVVSLPAEIPVTGQAAPHVSEYALVEQSADNPTNQQFIERARTAVAARNNGPAMLGRLPGAQDRMQAANKTLEAFNCRLIENSTAPFSAYAVYCGDALIQNNIAAFWPVSVNQQGTSMSGDFLLPVETMNGERLVVSSVGVGAWPGQGNAQNVTPPVYFGDQIAYADTNGGDVDVYAGGSLLFSDPDHSSARNFYSWTNQSTGRDHWALELDNTVILDGKDLTQSNRYDETFGLQVVNGQPLYFYTRDGLTRVNYAGRDLPFSYDQVVHGNQGDLAIFNPGGLDHMAWFYALRDGLWYYVEVGIKQ